MKKQLGKGFITTSPAGGIVSYTPSTDTFYMDYDRRTRVYTNRAEEWVGHEDPRPWMYENQEVVDYEKA